MGSRLGDEELARHAGRPGGEKRSQPSAWLRARARLAPRLLTQAPSWVRQVFDHDWAPMEALNVQAGLLPFALWDYLLSCEGGFVLVDVGESRYLPGQAEIRGQSVHNVAHLSVEDLARGGEQSLHVIGHLVDHYLGCGGEPDGPWLSDGGGVTSGWQQAGARLAGLFALGYGLDQAAQSNVRDYLAQSLAVYCRDRQRLNVADPHICRWLRNTLFEAKFWKMTRSEQERPRDEGLSELI